MSRNHEETVDDRNAQRDRKSLSASGTYKGRIRALMLAFFAVLMIWAYWPTICETCAAWTSNPDYTHGFFVIPISLWLLWARREKTRELRIAFDWRGGVLVAAAGLLRIAAARFYLPEFDAWSIPIWIGGVVWLTFGWSVFKWALPSIAFLWFATPLPASIEIRLSTPLQNIAASLSTFALRIIGQPAIVEGTTILLDDHVLDVERACSGLRMFYGIFALAFACIALVRPARWKSILVLVAAAPIAIAANVFRIVTTGILTKYASSEAAQKFSHDFAGFVMIPVAIGLFLLFLMVLGRVGRRVGEPGSVAWITKYSLGFILVIACAIAWGRYQGSRAISTLQETSNRYEAEKDWPNSIQFLSRYLRAVPDDEAATAHLAELYRDHAQNYFDRIRAVELLQAAWQRQPEREDFAISAIQIAMLVHEFKAASDTGTQLLVKTKDPKTRVTATKFVAQSLVGLLESSDDHGEYTWENAKDALEKSLQVPGYEIDNAQLLADIYRQRLDSLPAAERGKLADQLIDRVIQERAADPLAWLVRHQYRLKYASENKNSIAQAEQDLSQALALLDKQPENASGVRILLAAAAWAGSHDNNQRQAELLERAIKLAPADFRPYIALADLKRRSNTKEAREDAIRVLRDGISKSQQASVLLSRLLAALLVDNGQLIEADKLVTEFERGIPYTVAMYRGTEKLDVGLLRAQIINSRDGAPAALAYLRQLLDDSDVQLSERRSPQTVARGYAMLGTLYANLNAHDLALDAYRRAIRIDPTNNIWQMQAATLAQRTGDLEGAERDYQSLIRSGAATPETRLAMVEVELQRQAQRAASERDWRLANRLLKSVKEAGASAIAIRLVEAEILAASGEGDKAEAAILELTKDFPKNVQAWRALVILRQQNKNMAGALEAIDQLEEVSNHGIEVAALRASILASSGKKDDAVAEFTEALASASPAERPQVAIAFSRLLNQIERHSESLIILEQAHRDAPHNLQIVDTMSNMAWLDQDWKQLEKYEAWLKDVEGDNGTLWKAYRAQRLLATARSIQDPSFQEVIALSDTILRERPNWSKAQFLQGEIAYRMNHADGAAAAYQRAWELGGRGPILADRLIDLLTRQGRYDEARKYVVQVRDYINYSQGLFDRAIPYLTSGNDGEEMRQLAELWAKDDPKSSDARLRLGRVLLMSAESLPPEDKKKVVAQAEAEFRNAIELAPNDVRPWAASILLYGASPETRGHALQILEAFAKQESINEMQRTFVLAQLYDYLSEPSRAEFFYQQATAAAEADLKAPGASDTIARAAQFYLLRAPALAENYARAALAQNSSSKDARLVLMYLLVNRSDKASAREALQLLNDPATKDSIDPALETRLRAASLAQSGESRDLESAAELIRSSISQSREDKLLLARLYDRLGQIPPALELLEQLVRSPDAQPSELTEYLRFWQTHFLQSKNTEGSAQFSGRVSDIYNRLGTYPGQMPEKVRWQIRELIARGSSDKVDAAKIASIALETLKSPIAQKLEDNEFELLFQQVLVVLLQEKFDDAALLLTSTPPNDVPKDKAAIWLCHSFIVAPSPPNAEAHRLQIINGIQSAFADKPIVLQAVGDCLTISGQYEQAIGAYEQALKLAPNELMVRNNLALALAEITGRMPEARTCLAVALQADPENFDLIDTQATLDIIDKQPLQAIPVLEKIVASHRDNPILYLHLAAAYHDTNDSKRARANLLTASALGIGQRILSPRDKHNLEVLQGQYLNVRLSSAQERPTDPPSSR